MVTSEILASSYQTAIAQNSARAEDTAKEEKVAKEEPKTSEQPKKVESDVVSITRENMRAVEFSLSSFMEAIEKLNSVKDYLNTNPAGAVSLQGNIAAEAAALLL
mgnify:CR=1 FL=1